MVSFAIATIVARAVMGLSYRVEGVFAWQWISGDNNRRTANDANKVRRLKLGPRIARMDGMSDIPADSTGQHVKEKVLITCLPPVSKRFE